jgi:GT2 family glycosyltransferase
MVDSRQPTTDQKAGENSSPFFISVIIVNYNGLPYLERLFASLAAQTCPTFEIIFVDNASTDGSAEWVASHYPQTRLIRSARNLGFAAGNNLGIRAAKGELIATLNTDTQVEPDYLEKLSVPMRDTQVGSCAPLMLQFARRERIDAAGIGIDRAGFAWNLEAGKNARVVMGAREIFGACAGAALYRRTMLDASGLFDEEYFAFYEDVDLAWRARRAGWKCVLVPEARVYHAHGGSFRAGSPQKLFLLARNRWWTVLKNYPMPTLLFFLPLMLVADFVALARALVVYHSLAPLRGRVAALVGITRAFDKRRAMGTYSLTRREAV